MLTLNGMPVVVSDAATAALPRERWDWSGYRSPARAKRRRDRSRVITREPASYVLGGRLVIHPTLWRALVDDSQRSGEAAPAPRAPGASAGHLHVLANLAAGGLRSCP